MNWNDIQSVPRHIRMLSDYLVQIDYVASGGKIKFIFADSMDLVDPNYDFINDRSSPEREPYWDDFYPHEMLGYALMMVF